MQSANPCAAILPLQYVDTWYGWPSSIGSFIDRGAAYPRKEQALHANEGTELIPEHTTQFVVGKPNHFMTGMCSDIFRYTSFLPMFLLRDHPNTTCLIPLPFGRSSTANMDPKSTGP